MRRWMIFVGKHSLDTIILQVARACNRTILYSRMATTSDSNRTKSSPEPHVAWKRRHNTMFQKSVTLWLSFFLLCIGAAASAQTESPDQALSERLISNIDFSASIKASFKVSPDSKRVAYGARAGSRVFVVMDGKEGNHYDAILALGAEGKGRIVFDSADSLHYLAAKGRGIYLVEEGMK